MLEINRSEIVGKMINFANKASDLLDAMIQIKLK